MFLHYTWAMFNSYVRLLEGKTIGSAFPGSPGHRQVGEGHQQRRGGGRLLGAALLAVDPAEGRPGDVLRVDLAGRVTKTWR